MEKDVPSTDINHIEESVKSSNTTDAISQKEDGFKLTFGKFLAMLSFQLGYFSDTLVVIMLSAALTPINRDLGKSTCFTMLSESSLSHMRLGPSPHYIWIVTSQTVGGAAVAPVIGRFGDIFGRRKFLLLGNLLGVVGTVLSATAHDIDTLIGGGVLIGIASGMRQLAWSALGEIVPKKNRGLAFSVLQGSLGAGAAFGPVIGRFHCPDIEIRDAKTGQLMASSTLVPGEVFFGSLSAWTALPSLWSSSSTIP